MKKFLFVLVSCLCFSPPSLFAQPTSLDPVVVTATRAPRATSNVVSSVSVITADQIAASGATRLNEVLRDAVSLHVRPVGPAGTLSTPSIRGSESGQVLVLLGGIRMNSLQNGQFDLSNLPVSLDEVERIEVLRGPASSLYGADALGGVIQIFTKKAEDEPSTRLSWNEGRFDSRHIGFSTSGKKGVLRYRLGAARDYSDGYRENSELNSNDFQGLLGFDLGEGLDLEISAFHLENEVGSPGSTAFPTPDAEKKDENTYAILTLSGPLGPMGFRFSALYDRLRNEYSDPGAWTPEDDRHILETLGAQLQFDIDGERQAIVWGGDFYRDDLNSTAIGGRDQDRWSIFAQDEIQVAAWAKILLGVRYDDHSDFKDELSPRAGVLFPVSESTRLRVSVGRAYRAPTLNDRFWYQDFGFFKMVGDPDLDPETAWEYEVALDQELGSRGKVSLSGFRRDAKDLIVWQLADPNNPWGDWEVANVNRSRIWGAEFEGSFRLHSLVDTGANYTYLRPKDRETGEYITGKPRHQASAYFEIGPVSDARLRLAGNYVRYYPEASRRHKSHMLFDATLTRLFVFGDGVEMEATVGVKNLFNKDYEVRTGYPMPPRELHAGITAYF